MFNVCSYHHLLVNSPGATPRQEDFDQIEIALGVPLPDYLKDFLISASGGDLNYIFEARFASRKERLFYQHVLSAAQSTSPDGETISSEIVQEILNTQQRFDVSMKLLPIARDMDRGLLFIDLTPGADGKVIGYLGANPTWTSRRRNGGFTFLAESFALYLQRLQVNIEQCRLDLNAALEQKKHKEVEYLIEFLDHSLPTWRSDDRFSDYRQLHSAQNELSKYKQSSS